MKIFRTIKLLLFASMLTLTACGFHLRGQINLPNKLHTFYLDSASPYSPLLNEIRKTLSYSNITTVDSADKAPVTLFVNSDNLSYSQSTLGTSTSLRNYTVTYTVNYELRNPSGHMIAGPFSVSSSETITAVSGELLDNSSKLSQAKKSLQQDVITKMMFQISAKDTLAKLTSSISTQAGHY